MVIIFPEYLTYNGVQILSSCMNKQFTKNNATLEHQISRELEEYFDDNSGIFLLFFHENICCGYSLEGPH